MRFSQRAGDRITTFVQGLAGVESGYRHWWFPQQCGRLACWRRRSGRQPDQLA
jgi:hypothetical protein